VYVQTTKVAQDLDKVLLEVDVLLKGFDEDINDELGAGMEVVFRIEGGMFFCSLPSLCAILSPSDSIPVPLPQSLASLRPAWSIPGDNHTDHATFSASPVLRGTEPSLYPVVAAGGTFDHLHAGHKILLSMTAWIAEEKVIVGVTG